MVQSNIFLISFIIWVFTLLVALKVDIFQRYENQDSLSTTSLSSRFNSSNGKGCDGDNITFTQAINNREETKENPTQQPKYSILPKRIYSVIGLESSGTQFVSGVIQTALKLPRYREGSMSFSSREFRLEEQQTQVQHFSLPWGSVCTTEYKKLTEVGKRAKGPISTAPIVDVVLPSQCTRLGRNTDSKMIPIQTIHEECTAMAKEVWGTNGQPEEKASLQLPVRYPSRYQLDIVSHKEWYDKWGVEQYFIIVVRDKDVSFTSRKEHCPAEDLAKEEERVGTDIITDAIHRFIMLPPTDDGSSFSYKRKIRKEDPSYTFWDMTSGLPYQNNASTFSQTATATTSSSASNNNNEGNSSTRRRLVQELVQQGLEDSRQKPATLLPSRNNVVLVSYESLMKLGQTYVEMLYESLDIQSDYEPSIQNGNTKYINKSVPKKPVRPRPSTRRQYTNDGLSKHLQGRNNNN